MRAARLLAHRGLLRAGEVRRLLLALGLLLEVDARLRLFGFARLGAALRSPAADPAPDAVVESEWAEARRVARSLRRAARLVPGARCLHRALALALWLRRRGIAAELRIGVRRADETIEGHAWVEWRGVPLDEALTVRSRFAVMQRCDLEVRPNRPALEIPVCRNEVHLRGLGERGNPRRRVS